MGKIKGIAKYDLLNNKWKYDINDEEKGKAFSIVSYKKIINNDSDKYDYIIFCDGYRVENVSSDMENVKASKNGIDKIYNFFKNTNRNVIIKTILIDMDAPLEEDSKLLADLINKLEDANSINIIGISKCGVMAFNMAKYIKLKDKTNIYTIASPFTGTLMASPKYIYQKFKEIISSVISDEDMVIKISNALLEKYEGICSNSHMDYDIALPGGVNSNGLNKYDEKFLKNIFSKENIKGIEDINFYQNFTTGIDEDTFVECMQTLNFTGMGLCILNKFVMGGKTDGFVSTESQEEVEKYIDKKSIHLKSSHHAVFSNDRLSNKVLKIVNNNIKEYSKKKVR